MSTPQDFDPRPVEEDPTGMRALLSALPDPGPMPEDLVSRITASLAAELDWPVLDELATRRRRRPGRSLVVAAAAAVVVLGGGGLALSHGLPQSLVAQAGSADSAAAGGPAPMREFSDKSASGSAGSVVVVSTGTRYAASRLPAQAAQLSASDPVVSARVDGPADSGNASSALSSPSGARACASALGVPPAASIVVDVATVDGAPGAVLVALDAQGAGTAYAVGPTCGTGGPALLAGPVLLP